MQNEKRKLLDHNDWIKYQFKVALRPRLRDVLVHASFIETIVREEADPRYKNQFGPALDKLKLLREKCNLYLDGRLDEIDKLKNLRNELIHTIIKKKLDENEIITKIYEMRDLIKTIYGESKFIKNFIEKNYQVIFDVGSVPSRGREET